MESRLLFFRMYWDHEPDRPGARPGPRIQAHRIEDENDNEDETSCRRLFSPFPTPAKRGEDKARFRKSALWNKP
jgi:hypothetical protein